MNDEKGLSARDRLRVEAALDGELDASHSIAFERDLAANPELKALYERHAALRAAVRATPKDEAPASLRQRIEAMAQPRAQGRRRLPTAFAASLVLALAIGALIGAWRASTPSVDPRLAALIAGYMRGELSGQPFDVASSDRHTVKPWLTAHAPFGAEVIDLEPEGFPLVGGRVDIVDARAVPTLVYRRREHVIALSELPLDLAAGEGAATVEGYNVECWRDTARAYVAISDVDPADLSSFASAFRKAGKSSGP